MNHPKHGQLLAGATISSHRLVPTAASCVLALDMLYCQSAYGYVLPGEADERF